ncbi:MAG: branched-chain amino acid transport system ATP-binding protein [Chloroflexota bacterium]|nr:branched-chain amino acid transport system ATP-binding protein [Chloroflexota bacterium]
MSTQLALAGVTKNFGGVAALSDVSFDVQAGEILGLIGPNGAGKTTLLNCISGVYRLDAGTITLADQELQGRPAFQIARLGIGRTFQVVKPFPSMTVRQNAAMGAMFGREGKRTPPKQAMEEADAVLADIGLGKRADVLVTSLTIPERKRLEVARALAMRPIVLLLDEVMAGLTPNEVDEALEVIREVNGRGVTIVLIEHVMRVVVGVCQRAVVLHQGRVLVQGATAEVLEDDRVIEAYLGERYAKAHRRG